MALVEAHSGVRQAAIRFGQRVNGNLLNVPGVATGLNGGPLILGVTDSNVFTYGLGDPLNHADPTGENIIVVGVIIVAAAAAVGYSLWAYARAAEACRDYCRDQADAGLCQPGDTSCYCDCMAGGTGLITSTGGSSKISTGVGGGITATTDNE